jgi:biopolymer transport protein TolR
MAASGKHRFSSEINVVPYIDVMLVLLVIFMVTTPLLTQGVKVDLPKSNAKPLETPKEEPLVVSIRQDGSLYLNLGDKEAIKPIEEIQDSIKKVLAAKPKTSVLVWGDRSVPYGQVVTLMTQLEEAGVDQVGLVTEPLTEPPK